MHERSGASAIERLTWLFGAIFILTIPLRPQLGFISLLLLGLTGIWRTVKEGRKWRTIPVFFYAISAMFVVRLIWIAVADDHRAGWKSIESEGSLIAIPVAAMMLNITQQVRRWGVWIYIGMCTAVIFYSFALFVSAMKASELTSIQFLREYFQNTRANAEVGMLNWKLAHYSFISLMIIYGVHMGWYEVKTAVGKVLLSFFILLGAGFMILSGSKSGVGLFLIGFLVYAVFYFLEKASRPVATRIVMGAVVVVVLATSWVYSSGLYNKVDDARSMMVKVATESIARKPLFGSGTGSGAQVMHNEVFEYHYSYAVNHPHNQYLSELIQFGFIGSIPFFVFVVSSLLYSMRSKNGALFSVLVTGFLFMLVEAPLNSNKGQLPFLFAVSLLACSTVHNDHSNERS